MSILQEIIKASQLGTAKYLPAQEIFPTDLHAFYSEVKEHAEDNEDFFLKISASTFLYMESGRINSSLEGSPLEAPEEEWLYLSATTAQWLRNFSLHQEDRPLLEYFLKKAFDNTKLAPPDLIPELLDQALRERSVLKEYLVGLTGHRGKWLSTLNPEWAPLFSASKPLTDELWETGTKEDRKRYLQSVRMLDPTKGLELLKGTLPKENATIRVELLEVLSDAVFPSDEEYLELLLQDKSVKVRDTAYMLLRMIPTSRLVQRYVYWLEQGLELKEERSITLQKKKVLKVQKFEITEDEVFKSGIQKISSEKGKQDHIYWLEQLCSWVPPSWWAKFMGEELEEVITLLRKEKETVFLAKAMMSAAVLFEDKVAAKILSKAFPGMNPDLLPLLSTEEAFEQLKNSPDGSVRQVMNHLLERGDSGIWPENAVEFIISFLTKNPYSINVQEYGELAIHFSYKPINILRSKIEAADPKRYEQAYFAARCEQMLSVIERKKQIDESFV